MPTLDDALTLARAGWAVLPLSGKVPLTRHGVIDATTAEDRIREWWSRGAPNVGARVPSPLVVLDFDPQNGGTVAELERALAAALPRTLTVHSGRGTGGQHRYYLHPGGPLTSSRLPAGIDVKTDRGYCVMPPSLHPATGKPYQWEQRDPQPLPAALVELMRPPTPKSLPRRPRSASGAERAVRLAHYVQGLAEGNRNAGLYWAACRLVEEGGSSADLTLLEGAAMVAGLDEQEALRTILSARRSVRQR